MNEIVISQNVIALLIKPQSFCTAIFCAILISLPDQIHGQQTAEYFDFWTDGTWESALTIYNGDTIPEKDVFIIRKLDDKDAFLEKWNIYVGDGEFVDAAVMRGFDRETDRWKLFYVDDRNAQTWDSRVIDGKVYFFKQFNFNGRTFYSRQAWSALENGRVLRTIERSEDDVNWTPRYYQIFRKAKE